MNKSQVLALAALLAVPVVTSAAEIYSDNFNTNSATNYNINLGGATSANTTRGTADFAFDYSVYGIPSPVPGGDTLGLKLKANTYTGNTRPGGSTSGLSISPTSAAATLGTTYQVSFYAWSNYFGGNTTSVNDATGSEGGTNNVLFAVGTSGTNPLVLGNPTPPAGVTLDGVVFGTTGDGGITQDNRVFIGGNTQAPIANGNYAAGTANTPEGVSPTSNAHPYYASLFPSHAVPDSVRTAELALAIANGAPADTKIFDGTTAAGSFGFAWHKVDLVRSGNFTAFYVDGTLLASADASAITLGSTFAFGASDVNTTSARHPDLVFTLIDNLVVSDVITVPEPTSAALALPALALLARRRRA